MALLSAPLLRCILLLSFALLALAGAHGNSTRSSCSTSTGLSRVVGRYEGWSIDRTCQPFVPEKIPKGIYTHLNYAYAVIDPTTFEVRPASIRDPDMYRRFTRLKRRDSNLKTSIAIGNANNPDQAARTFLELAHSEVGKRAFFNSLLSFLATYDFDGVDFDWRLPVALEEELTNDDYTILHKLIADLRGALKNSAGGYHLSLTLSMSNWQLQRCDISSLEKNVDFLVLLSYNSLDTWDYGTKSLNAHTNLTDTDRTLDLLWSEGVRPHHVVLGTSFDGRAYTVMDSDCLEPGCPYASESEPQSCTREVGLISNIEIKDIINRTGRKPVLHEDAAVQVLTFDHDQWVAYDDEKTLAMKTEYAQTSCLGGMMAWISRDTPQTLFSMAINEANNRHKSSNTEPKLDPRNISARLSRNGADTVLRHPQCMWTNCNEECPAGYSNVPNSAEDDWDGADIGVVSASTMTDATACLDSSVRQWCCPTLDMPKCYWSGIEHGGTCTSSCPSESVEIASDTSYCENGGYAAACCDPSDGNSVSLYHTCTWSGKAKEGADGIIACGDGEASEGDSCPDSLSPVARSQSGSGAVQCEVLDVSPATHAVTYSTRTYCCDTSDYNLKWGSCSKHGTDGHTEQDPGHCPGDCPDSHYRVALDQHAPECSSGAAATCCVPMAQTLDTNLDEEVRSQAEALDVFLTDTEGYCVNDTERLISDLASSDETTKESKRSLGRRAITLEHPAPLSEVKDLLTDLLDNRASHEQIDAWDSSIGEDYPFLRTYALEPYMNDFPNRSFASYGDYLEYHGINYGGVRDVACATDYFDTHVAATLGSEGDNADLPLTCNCGGANVCGADGESCSVGSDVDEEFDGDDDPEDSGDDGDSDGDENGDESVCRQGDEDCTSGEPVLGGSDDDDDEEEENKDGDKKADKLRIRALEVGSQQFYHLFKRGGGDERDFKFKVTTPDNTVFNDVITSYSYHTAGEWADSDPIWARGFTGPPVGRSLVTTPGIITKKANWVLNIPGDRVTEHIFELVFPARVIAGLAEGRFEGKALSTGALPSAFITWILQGQSQVGAPALTGMIPRLMEYGNKRRLMWTLGNKYNKAHFVICSKELNDYKTKLWNGKAPKKAADAKKDIAKIGTGPTDQANIDFGCAVLCFMKQAISVLEYLNDPTVHDHFATVNNAFREELARQYREWQQSTGQQASDSECKKAYDEIIKLKLEGLKERASDFVSTHADGLRHHIDKKKLDGNSWAKQLKQSAQTLENRVAAMQMKTSKFNGLP